MDLRVSTTGRSNLLPGKKKSYQTFSVLAIILCMLPGILHYVIFRLVPSAATGVLSFTDITGVPGASWDFIGWANYREFFILQNVRDLKASLSRTVTYSLSVTIIQNSIALFMAILLNRKFVRFRNGYRAVFFLPVILGVTVVATIWKLVFSTPNGPVFLLMKDVFNIANPPAILSSFSYAFTAVIASQIWMHMGYSLIIFLAGLQSIPNDVYESAHIDGAGEWKTFWKITLPLLWPALTVNTLLAIIGSLQSFELILTITAGQFNTSTLGMMVFATAFGGRGATPSGGTAGGLRQGYAASQSMVLFAAVFFVTVISQVIMSRMEKNR